MAAAHDQRSFLLTDEQMLLMAEIIAAICAVQAVVGRRGTLASFLDGEKRQFVVDGKALIKQNELGMGGQAALEPDGHLEESELAVVRLKGAFLGANWPMAPSSA